ncbi:MAG: diguanylate cyclase [Candidatus Omnitrophica bacterium]|nr:diguanylate cyclase [Candidatus Omnitrophota bacterium]
MPRLKLQARITVLIAGISILLISIFASIQLRNHIESLNSYNQYRARVGTIIVKTTLEMMIKDLPLEETAPGIFQVAVDSFARENIVEKISIISMNGAVIATNDPLAREFGESKDDIDTYFRLSAKSPEGAWFYSIINPNTKNIDIYIPLYVGAAAKYITKLSFSMANITKAMTDILVPIALTAIAVIIGNLILGYLLSKTVVRPIASLNRATKEIASGNFDLSVRIRTNDEIQELGDTVNLMTIALKKMKETAENANPLTKLPGNNVIREKVEECIRTGKKFTAIHVDLDNFKVYNDRYGIGKGDELIKFTARVLEDAVKEKGNNYDFIGHEGGDDFFLITTPDKADALAEAVISEFDTKIKDFYSKEDLATGYITEKDRRGQPVKFPIMSISLAGVTNQYRPISSYGELTNIAVAVKHKVKQVQKSTFLFDRRHE